MPAMLVLVLSLFIVPGLGARFDGLGRGVHGVDLLGHLFGGH